MKITSFKCVMDHDSWCNPQIFRVHFSKGENPVMTSIVTHDRSKTWRLPMNVNVILEKSLKYCQWLPLIQCLSTRYRYYNHNKFFISFIFNLQIFLIFINWCPLWLAIYRSESGLQTPGVNRLKIKTQQSHSGLIETHS